MEFKIGDEVIVNCPCKFCENSGHYGMKITIDAFNDTNIYTWIEGIYTVFSRKYINPPYYSKRRLKADRLPK